MCGICNDTKHDDLNDNLEDIFGAPSGLTDVDAASATMQAALARATHEPVKGTMSYEEPCPSCKGSGRFYSYTGRLVGNCFKCKGSGKLVFKTSPEARAKNAEDREAVKAAKAKAINEAANAWYAAHTEETVWLFAASGRGFDFASSMIQAIIQYGRLTDKQLEAVRRCITRDQLREEERAEIAAKAPDITGDALSKITTAFETAIDKGIKFPKMRLDEYLFALVRTGANTGAIYVKTIERDANAERTYLGKIVDGRFVRSMKCDTETQQRIIAAAMDPEAAAKAYGFRTGSCSICGRKLTKGESIDLGIGPICNERYGWS